MPDDDAAEILGKLNRLVSNLDTKLRLRDERCFAAFHVDTDIPSFGGEPMEPAGEFCRSLTGENQARNVVSYATEAGHFQRAGVPTVVCGPGTIEQAHKPDEYIERSQIEACEKFIGRLISVQAA